MKLVLNWQVLILMTSDVSFLFWPATLQISFIRVGFSKQSRRQKLGNEFCPRLPSPRDSPHRPQEREIVVFPIHLHVGLRWPLTLEIIDLCHYLGATRTRLSSNSWWAWLCMFLWRKEEDFEFLIRFFQYFYRFSLDNIHGQCYFTPQCHVIRWIMVKGKIGSNFEWKKSILFIKDVMLWIWSPCPIIDENPKFYIIMSEVT